MAANTGEGKNKQGRGNASRRSNVLELGKGYIGQVKMQAVEYGLSEALSLLDRSDENYSRLAKAIGTLAKNPTQKTVANWVADFLAPGKSGSQYLNRLFTSVHPNFRRKYISRFLTSLIFHDNNDLYKLEDGREIPVPAAVVISPTMRCNLSCVGCYAFNYSKKDDMSPELFESAIQQAREIGVRFFIITGGEPLIYQPLFDILEKFNDCAFQFYTSGHLLNDKVVSRLVKMGHVIPAISIEGFQDLHDARRGEGSFKHVMAGMDRLREARALFAFSVTASRYNIDVATSDAFIDLMVEKGAGYGWYFSYIPIGRSPDMGYMPTPEQRDQLRIAVDRIRHTKPLLVADFWNDGSLTEGCLAAGRRYLHINNKGDVEPCVFIHFAVDNIKTTPLKKALASKFFQTLRAGQPYGKNLLLPCPIIDHPRVLRRVVDMTGAQPTHNGAESVITELAGSLDAYAHRLQEIYDRVWDEEYRWTEILYSDAYTLRSRALPQVDSISLPGVASDSI